MIPLKKWVVVLFSMYEILPMFKRFNHGDTRIINTLVAQKSLPFMLFQKNYLGKTQQPQFLLSKFGLFTDHPFSHNLYTIGISVKRGKSESHSAHQEPLPNPLSPSFQTIQHLLLDLILKEFIVHFIDALVSLTKRKYVRVFLTYRGVVNLSKIRFLGVRFSGVRFF